MRKKKKKKIDDSIKNVSFLNLFLLLNTFEKGIPIKFILMPEGILLSWLLFLLIFFIFKYNTIKSSKSYFLWYLIKIQVFMFILISILSFFLSYMFFTNKTEFYYKLFIFDFYTSFFKSLIFILLSIGFVCCFSVYQYYNKYIFEAPLIFSFLGFFLMFLISSFDFISVFFCTEGITFSLVALIAYNYNSEDSTFSSMKYLVLGSLSSGLFGFGCILLYGLTNRTNFYSLKIYLEKILILRAEGFENNYLFINGVSLKLGLSLAVLFIIFGFFFKLSISPMHQWSISIYSSSIWGLIFIFSTVVKLSFFSIFMRSLFYPLISMAYFWGPVIGYSALMSLFIGSFGAIAASSFKEFLAYSSLGQLGFLMLGLASGNFKTAVSSLFFLIYYVVSMVIILLILSFYTKEDGSLIYSFNDLRFLSKKPLQAFFFSVAIINMSGIPPLPGFFSKFFILHSLVSGGNFIYTGVALFLSLVTMFYYIRVILLVWLDFFNNSSDKNTVYLFNNNFTFKDYLIYFVVYFLHQSYIKKCILVILFILVTFILFSVFFFNYIWEFLYYLIASIL